MIQEQTKRGRPRGTKRVTKERMKRNQEIVQRYKAYLPEQYMPYILQELEKMNYPTEEEQTRRRIHSVIQGKLGDSLITLAIKIIGEKFKKIEEELESILE